MSEIENELKKGKEGEGGGEDQKITIDGKEFGAEDVRGIIKESESLGGKLKEMGEVARFCEDNSVSPEVFLGHAKGALSTLANLVDLGVVDDEGNVVEKRIEGESEGEGKEGEDWLGEGIQEPKEPPKIPLKGAEGAGARALESVNTDIGEIKEGLKILGQQQKDMLRLNFQEKILTKHPNLDADDVSRVFAAAARDPLRKGLFVHAEEFSERKKNEEGEKRKEFAKEFNINLEEFDENKIKEQDSKGGAATFFKGKKFSFRKGKDSVAPKEAAKEFLEKTL